ncbi:hypothetical protein Ccrd_018101 [Cynara cardunculus var. scolymus]|uniref:Uncharacterized protein n=1 Tax=Cynara cardunculus var. scolymus TaxID=59895 RepID=A0A103Y6U5_CYNCS|nr:hypothetical protein Ccrd_018101 [Cynara cardunculus var. scolymus]
MRKFDPWPVFFKREFSRNWPFLVGFAVTGTIITKFSLGLTEEDRKNSVFAQRHKRCCYFFLESASYLPEMKFVLTFELIISSNDDWKCWSTASYCFHW